MKKAQKIIGKVAVWVIIVLTVAMMIFTLVSVSTFDKLDRSLFGYNAMTVLTDSMSENENYPELKDKIHFNSGDLIFVKTIDPKELQIDDAITYWSDKENKVITHAIWKIETPAENEEHEYKFYTYGTNNGEKSDEPITYIIGKYRGRLPGIGHFFTFLKTTPGYIVCILVPFLLLIMYNGINVIRLFRKYKKEQTAKLEEERKQIESERQKQLEMMAQLQALKDELDKRQGAAVTTPTEQAQQPQENAAEQETPQPADSEQPTD